jgi:hypothetical protein
MGVNKEVHLWFLSYFSGPTPFPHSAITAECGLLFLTVSLVYLVSNKSSPTEYILGKSRKRGSVSAFSAGAYTITLHMMVDIEKGVGVHLQPHQTELIFPS